MEKISEQKEKESEFENLVFGQTQKIQQQRNESGGALHERLRRTILNAFQEIERPTKIRMPSWYTFDLAKIGIEGGVAISTSTCKHEIPCLLFVGKREKGWMKELPGGLHEYTIFPLGRKLTDEERNKIYDLM